MGLKSFSALLSASVLAAAGISSAHAATIISLINTAPNNPAAIKLHDQSYEYLSTDTGTAGHLDTGDVITAYLRFTTLTPGSGSARAIGVDTVNDELTAKVVLQVTGKFDTGTTSGGLEQYKFTFGPSAAFNAALSTQYSTSVTNAMVAVYTQSAATADAAYANTDSVATIDTETTNGSLFWLLGFNSTAAASHLSGGNFVSDNGEGWTAIGADLFDLGSFSTGTVVGSSTIGVNRVSGLGLGAGLPVQLHSLDALKQGPLGLGTSASATPFPFIQFDGHSDLTGSDNVNFAASNLSDFTFTVPEPASLSLLGLGATLVLARRRKLKWDGIAQLVNGPAGKPVIRWIVRG